MFSLPPFIFFSTFSSSMTMNRRALSLCEALRLFHVAFRRTIKKNIGLPTGLNVNHMHFKHLFHSNLTAIHDRLDDHEQLASLSFISSNLLSNCLFIYIFLCSLISLFPPLFSVHYPSYFSCPCLSRYIVVFPLYFFPSIDARTWLFGVSLTLGVYHSTRM